MKHTLATRRAFHKACKRAHLLTVEALRDDTGAVDWRDGYGEMEAAT